LFAVFTRSTPAHRSVRAFSGGAWKGKQVELTPATHFDDAAGPNVPSRLTTARSLRRSIRATFLSCVRPRWGGSPR
jgi:hypothetical protein